MNRKLWENIASLYGIHIFNYVVPLMTLPFLARILGTKNWGALAFAEAYATYISLVIEYGFGLSASREVATFRDNTEARSRHLSAILGAQGLLALVALVCSLVCAITVPAFLPYRDLLPFAYGLAVARAISPVWYFQGLEKMKTVAALNIIANISAAACILLFVHVSTDTKLPLVFRGCASLASSLTAFALAYRETPPVAPSIRESIRALSEGSSLFLFRSAVSLYTTANVLLLGALQPPTVVALFAGAEKLAKAAVSGTAPVTQAFYPRISYLMKSDKEGAQKTAKASAMLTIGIGIATGLVLLFGAPLLVHVLLGKGFVGSIPVLRLFALLPPVIATSNLLGVQWMLPLRLDKSFNIIIAGAGAANLVLAFIFAPRFGQMGMAFSVVIAEILVTTAMFAVLRLKNLDPWSSVPEEECVAV